MMKILQSAADNNTDTALNGALTLMYNTTASCHLDLVLASSGDALATNLLPINANFRGNMQFLKTKNGNGCALYLTIKGALSSTVAKSDTIFDVSRNVHQKITEQLNVKGYENVVLAQITIALDTKQLVTMSLTTEKLIDSSKHLTTAQDEFCKKLLNSVQGGEDSDMLLPGHVEVSVLDASKLAKADENANCIVSLDVSAMKLSTNANAEAFQLFGTVDERMRGFLATQSNAALASANARMYPASTDKIESLDLAVGTMGSDNTTLIKNAALNLPSQEEALGIIALGVALVAMLVGVVVQKKRNDRCSRDRYERANRIAQIHRVSIAMKQRDESQDYEGEEDSLM